MRDREEQQNRARGQPSAWPPLAYLGSRKRPQWAGPGRPSFGCQVNARCLKTREPCFNTSSKDFGKEFA